MVPAGRRKNIIALLSKFLRPYGSFSAFNAGTLLKNGDVVRKTVGYARFEGQNALHALIET
jgi:hypothetical protein